MELRPILSAMLRNKTGVILVGLQIAITLAVVANAVFIIMQRYEKIQRPAGYDSDNLIFVQSYGFGPTYDHRDTVRRDLDLIRALPGVVNASVITTPPLSSSRSATAVGPVTDRNTQKRGVTLYEIDEHGLEALGVKLVEGRGFTEQEIQFNPDASSSDWVPAVILTRDAARALYGEERVLGKTLYDSSNRPATVVDIIENMLGPVFVVPGEITQNMLAPRIPPGPTARYVVRAEPGERDALISEIERKLTESNAARAITYVHAHTQIKDRSYRPDSRMIAFLGVLVGLMIVVTALGIVGLASFHVSVRTKQIGTRRAVGARRIDIIRYFMVENWLLTTGGVVLGAVLAFGFGHWLSSAFALPRLEPGYVVGGILVLWVLGQLAAFIPARRAAAIPPAIATRTV